MPAVPSGPGQSYLRGRGLFPARAGGRDSTPAAESLPRTRSLLAARSGRVNSELSRDPTDELVASASRHADTVAEPATDEWWAALFADLDARLAVEVAN